MDSNNGVETMIKLNYLKVNQAYMFTYGDSMLRMGPENKLFFRTRTQAVDAAKHHGLTVDSSGRVS